MLRPRHLAVAFPSAALVVIAGCTGGQSADVVAGSANFTQTDAAAASAGIIDPRVVLKGQEFGRCWFQPGAAADTSDFVCQGSKKPGYPWDLDRFGVSLRAISDGFFLGGTGSAPDVTNEAKVRATGIRRDEFPLDVDAMFDLFPFASGTDDSLILDPDLQFTDMSRRVAAPSATKDDPIVFTQPFDLWPVRIVNTNALGYAVGSDPYPFDMPGATDIRIEDGQKTSEVGALVKARITFQPTQTLYLPVPRNGKIALTIVPHRVGVPTDDPPQPFVLDGPGVFILELTGLRRATDAEIAKLVPELPPRSP